MLPRTRAVVRLLTDDVAAEVLAVCSRGEASEAYLREKTGASHASLAMKLELLRAQNIIARRLHRTEKRGRPAAHWRLVAGEQVEQFDRVADALVLRLLEQAVDDQRAGLRDRVRDTVTDAANESQGRSEPPRRTSRRSGTTADA